MTDLTPEDIAAARREGDLVALLLMSAGLTPAAVPKQRAPEPETDNIHIAHPGAWPTGTSRPTPVPPATDPQIDAATSDYRRWLLADRPPANANCPCIGCTSGRAR
ncbi:hypothetical protein OS965_02195 [Streptomyces sp. H27-G5]|uniref:hypothetical protein n=1 Tax=Streptomyces sp. H27-G5 TaxID=2996698 RepID=UPI00226EAED5|nr:hypothetical protein [Streptomyces sp. H27-G5]MCY0916986.1 hypothetical protein [Streptomyces sp. H27-G5]